MYDLPTYVYFYHVVCIQPLRIEYVLVHLCLSIGYINIWKIPGTWYFELRVH
jgi:hypothetical protein